MANDEQTPEGPRLIPDEVAHAKLPDEQRDAVVPSSAPSEVSGDPSAPTPLGGHPEQFDHVRADPSHEGRPPRGGPCAAGRVEGLSKVEAERLLDWLEANGCPSFGLTLAGTGFVVEFDWGARESCSAEKSDIRGSPPPANEG